MIENWYKIVLDLKHFLKFCLFWKLKSINEDHYEGFNVFICEIVTDFGNSWASYRTLKFFNLLIFAVFVW